MRQWSYEDKAGFFPTDVIEEYTRTVFYVDNNELVEKEALSEIESVNIGGIGTLEAFNTDRLRSLSKTMDIPNMVEKTLKYPGHAEKMKVLRASRFFSKKIIDVYGKSTRPVDLTSKLLFPMWELKNNEIDMTVMKVIASGKKSGNKASYECVLHYKYDQLTGAHSMARTTGYTVQQ